MESDSPTDLQRSPDDRGCASHLSVLPEKLQQRLMPFQKEGVAFALSRDGRCMIADEMGLGKTIQAISVAYSYRREWPLLIVVPSSLKYPWIEEMERWIPELNPGDINLVETKSDTTGISTSKVTVLGYGLLTTDARSLVEALTRQKFAVVVVDESHYLKSKNAARSKILVPLIQSAKRAILLTGTPALGRPEELFTQIDSLYPKMFGTWSDYTKKYCNAHYRFFGNRRQWDCRGASHLEELHQRLSEIMIRRLKTQVLTQLPPKIRQRIPFDLPKEAAKEACASFEEWERLMKRLGSGPSAPDTDGNPFTQVMGVITRMYKQTAVAKAGAVKDYIKMLLETDELKFLVFAHHLTMLQACTEAVIEAKAGYIRIDGSVPSSERIQLVHRFQNDPSVRVAVLSIQAAGQGLTFTAASHVVFAELYWNPGHVKQAEDRAHRIGQTASVHVHYLIAKGTFDTVMWGMLNRKETVTGSTLNGRKEYLNAEVGDKDKWDFLNFSSAWTPSRAPVGGEPEADKDGVFFSHFEKDKQHDIRSFFSPNAAKEKKRKRGSLEGEGGRPGITEEEEETLSPAPSQPDEDFSPQVKRLRTPGPSPRSRLEAKRRSGAGRSSPQCPLFGPRRLSESAPARPEVAGQGEKWSCGACTYCNSSLMRCCEMCESPRPTSEPTASSATEPPSQPQPGPHPGAHPGPAPHTAPEPHTDTRQPEEDEGPGGKQSAGESHSPLCDHTEAQTDRVCPSSPTEEDGSDSLPLYPNLKFCTSKNTDRVYLYTKDGTPLNCNFIPLDISLDNWEDLPLAFRRRENSSQVLRFVREWTTLTAMKQRLVRRSGQLFHSPILALDELASTQRRPSSTKRYLRREDVAEASLSKAQQEGGSVRVIATERFFSRRSSAPQPSGPQPSGPQPSSPQPSGPQPPAPAGPQPLPPAAPEKESEAPAPPTGDASEPGYLQAVDSAGVPLCLLCQKACPPVPEGASDARFCSQRCQEEFQLRSSQAYMRARVLQTEQGVCQHCGLQAHQLYLRVRDAPPSHRKEILEGTWLEQLSLKQLNEMIRNPVDGHFWQVDHIRPVYSGGGQCSLDNLQTLCTVCHRSRTAQQAKERSQMKRGLSASKVASDISRFFIKK